MEPARGCVATCPCAIVSNGFRPDDLFGVPTSSSRASSRLTPSVSAVTFATRDERAASRWRRMGPRSAAAVPAAQPRAPAGRRRRARCNRGRPRESWPGPGAAFVASLTGTARDYPQGQPIACACRGVDHKELPKEFQEGAAPPGNDRLVGLGHHLVAPAVARVVGACVRRRVLQEDLEGFSRERGRASGA